MSKPIISWSAEKKRWKCFGIRKEKAYCQEDCSPSVELVEFYGESPEVVYKKFAIWYNTKERRHRVITNNP